MTQATLCDPEETAPATPDGGCVNYAECQKMTPGGAATANQICDDCLSEARARDSNHE